MSSIGDRLKAARERLGITQTRAADAIGVNRKTFGGWENDVAEPNASNLAKLAELYEVTTDYLIIGKNPITKKPELSDVLRQMDSEFERVKLDPVDEERVKEMLKLMLWDKVKKSE